MGKSLTPAQYEAFQKLFGPSAAQPTQAVPQPSPVQPVVSTVNYGANSAYSDSGDLIGQPQEAAAPAGEDSGWSWGGFFSGLLGGLGGGNALSTVGSGTMSGLSAIDVPRSAIVSATKEAIDTFEGSRLGHWYETNGIPLVGGVKLGGSLSEAEYQKRKQEYGSGSWKDWLAQTKGHMGFGEIVQKVEPNMPHPLKVVTGIAGDIISDPLTYVHPGVSMGDAAAGAAARTAAQETADKALRFAVKDGSSSQISHALIQSAEHAGFEKAAGGLGFADEAVNKLIVNAAKKGRGALTEAGLREAGIDAEKAAALGIGDMQKTFLKGAITVPGSTRMVNASEAAKGAMKEMFREAPGAAKLRNIFMPNAGGRRLLTNIIMDSHAGLSEQTAATIARSTINEAMIQGRRWGVDNERAIFLSLKKSGWSDLSKEAGINATHAAEAGVESDLQSTLRQTLDGMHQDLVDRKVLEPGQYIPNYVPHYLTEDAVKLEKRNPIFKKFIEKSLDSTEGFMRPRTVKTTIQAANEASMREFGIKIFEDDARNILQRYVRQAQEAIIRQAQVDALKAHGLVTEVGQTLMKRLNEAPEYLAHVAETEAKAATAKAASEAARGEAATLRREALSQTKQALQDEAKSLREQIRQTEEGLVKMHRKVGTLRAKLESAQGDMNALGVSLRKWERVAKTARSSAERVSARNRVNKLTAMMAEHQSAVSALESQISDLTQEANRAVRAGDMGLATATSNTAAETAKGLPALEEKLTELKGRLTNAEKDLAKTAAPVDFTQHWVDKLKGMMAAKAIDVSKNRTAYADAADVYAFAVGDSQHVLKVLNERLVELDAAISHATVGKLGTSKTVKWEVAQELRDRLHTVAAVLADPNQSPAAKAIAGIEAAAAKLDIEALDHAHGEAMFLNMLKTAEDQKFIDFLKRDSIRKGMVGLGHHLQMPEWLHEATTIEQRIRQLPMFGKFGRKFYNLFKGYAISTPGFHMRNAYTAMFNMYLEAGPEVFQSAKRWHEFYGLTQKFPATYMDIAEKRFGAEDAARLQAAWGAVAGSGSGQTAGEFASEALRKGSWNPTSENFRFLRGNRKIGESIENHVRGIHAYDVMKRGGTESQALDIINKWHFNYTDLTTFDNAMKKVMPFWVFWSRNVALQSQTWMRSAVKLNRTWKNFERNMGMGQSPDTLEPEFLRKNLAMRIPNWVPGFGDNPLYFTPDLPAVKWPSQVDSMSSLSSDLLSNLGPWFKVPAEAYAGKSFYTGAKISDKYVPMPVGMGAALKGMGVNADSLPTDTLRTGASGMPMIRQDVLAALTSSLPLLAKYEQLMPTNGNWDKQKSSIVSTLLGLGIQENTPLSQQNELIRRKILKAEQAKREASLKKG